jgi:surface antigen
LGAAVGGDGKAIAAGTILGGLLGAGIGEYLNQRDQRYMSNTTYDALENAQTGQTRTWDNPDSGHSGAITPVKTYATAEGRNCREFRQTVTIEGREESAYGTACREPDGSWRIVQ